uniref:Uncharacterized protein n=1 Tax=Panagrolaimus sp. ES5 TaxID=591445 RepID=A0AC34FLH9_9BILA
MGNSLPKLRGVKVINRENQRLKVRADCNRMITNCKFSASIKGIKLSGSVDTTVFYIVDTSNSFVFIPPNTEFNFTLEGETCYLSACDENDVPLFTNHPVPTFSTVICQNGLPIVEGRRPLYLENPMRTFMAFDVLFLNPIIVINESNVTVRARVDCDEGICSIDYDLAAKGCQIHRATTEIVLYKVDKQGYTTLKPGQNIIFYVKPVNNSCYVTLQYVDSDDEIKDICKNHREKMIDTQIGLPSLTNPRMMTASGPVFTVESDPTYVTRLKQGRFKCPI